MISLDKKDYSALWDKKMFWRIWWRMKLQSIAFSQPKMMSAGFCIALTPWLKALYPGEENKEKFAARLVAHQPFYNCTPETSYFIMGLCCAMEREGAEDENFDLAAVSAIKAALMGPLSGVGDAIFWVTVRTIAASVAITLAKDGNILGLFAFPLIYHALSVPFRIVVLRLGYNMGSSFLEAAYESGAIEMLTLGATCIGLMMVGAMAANFVNLNFAIKLDAAGATTLQSTLDGVVPKINSLWVTLATLWALRKGKNATFIIVVMLAVGILGKLIGLF
jgi:fructoselysine and glucoselysine-specific PTS system IID component